MANHNFKSKVSGLFSRKRYQAQTVELGPERYSLATQLQTDERVAIDEIDAFDATGQKLTH